MVKQYTEDPSAKDTSGIYTFARGRAEPEFEAAAFSLKTNQISDIVETQYGYHIIKGLERFPAKHDSFAESKAKIKAYLVEKDAEKTLPAYLDKLKADAGVKVLDSQLAKPGPAAAR